MRTVRRNARVKYSADQMFELVNDIASYPEFLPWCHRATIHRRTNDAVEATLEVGLRGVHKAFSTRNRLERPRRMRIELLRGPFRSLEGEWTFTEREDGGCGVGLELHFEVSHSPLNAVFGLVFEEIARSQVAAFTRRAKDLYG